MIEVKTAPAAPIKTPMLERILDSAMKTYIDMTVDETRALNEEIKAVVGAGHRSDIYDVAKMLEDRVSKYVEFHLPPR